MCQFNLLIIDKDQAKSSLKDLFQQNGFGFKILENTNLKAQIGDSKSIILTTKGHCDCGSVIGYIQQNTTRQLNIKKEKIKLSKKKWSKAKIERYINDKLKESNKEKNSRNLGNQNEVDRWINILNKLKYQTKKIGILFHQFSSDFDNEEITILSNNYIDMSEVKKELFENFKENELNWIVN